MKPLKLLPLVLLVSGACAWLALEAKARPAAPIGGNQIPVCCFGADCQQSGLVAEVQCTGSETTYVLDASGSYDPEGVPLTFFWQSCPGSTIDDPMSPITVLRIDTSASCDVFCGVRLVVSDGLDISMCRLFVQVVEGTPTCVLPITNCSNFNGTTIPAGRHIWFNSVLKPSNLGTGGAEIFISDARVEFTVNGHPFNLPVPDAHITYSTSASSASTTFDAVAGQWETIVPAAYAGNVFMTGLSYLVPENLPGGINPVCLSATISTSTPGASFKWKWAAAVYTQFSDDHGALGVKPIDGSAANPYPNAHHAGTPENFAAFVTGGARGGGGSNFTGSYSGTVSGACP